MPDYKKMYHEMLIGSERAIAAIDEGRPDTARQSLIIAEHRAESGGMGGRNGKHPAMTGCLL